MSAVGKSTSDAGYLQVLRAQEELRQLVLVLMADQRLDALVYATFDHQPGIIADDVMTRTVVPDFAGIGNNRRLSPVIGFPAVTVPAGFTTDGVPVGIEIMTRPFTEAMLLKIAYSYEQGTRHHQPPPLGTAGQR
jgi:Asp-tRNA(Asn)/Glu-tRNA(Gln) amidotransferase A subunit family amidase